MAISDSFFNPDPDVRDSVVSDTFMNTRYSTDGDVWYGVIDEFTQTTAWDILNVNEQDISWSVFARTLYFLQQFTVKPIAFNFETMSASIVPWPGLNLSNDYTINTPIKYKFTVQEPTHFDIYLATVLRGEEDTVNRG